MSMDQNDSHDSQILTGRMSRLPSRNSILSVFTAMDGDNIAIRNWPIPEEVVLRGVVLIVHGLGEHSGRFEALAEKLGDWGFASRAFDLYGHGESGGRKGALPTDTRLLHDLLDVIESTRAQMNASTPLILLGHSMGGLIAARFVSLKGAEIEGLVLSSPALKTRNTPFKKFLIDTFYKFAPNTRFKNRLDAKFLSHDPEVGREFMGDPLCHDRISARLARFIESAGEPTIAQAKTWHIPTLLMYAGDDRFVDPDGSRRFAADAPPRVVTAIAFDGAYHELFNEPDPSPALEALKSWLDSRF